MELEIGKAEVSLEKIPSTNWYPIMNKEKEVRGILQISLSKSEIVNRHVIHLPRVPSALLLEDNVATTLSRHKRIDHVEGKLDELQKEANKEEPDLQKIATEIKKKVPFDYKWKNGRGQTLLHLVIFFFLA